MHVFVNATQRLENLVSNYFGFTL